MADSGSLSQKVVALAAGEAHTLALTGDGRVYSWGRGTFGRLGTGKEDDELFPVRVGFDSSRKTRIFAKKSELERPKFIEIAAGAYHSLALEDDGSVWCWGYNLGLNVENSSVPCLLERFLELGSPDSLTDESSTDCKTHLKVLSVQAGGMMSLAIDSIGTLWIWGNCPQPSKSSDGEFSLTSSSIPLPVWDFHGHTVVKVACGNEHVVALVSAGETFMGSDLICYSWGSNNHGQLGLGDLESRLNPEMVENFNLKSPFTAYEVACGAFHTAVLTHNKFKSICWTFGLGDNGQLGHGTTNSTSLPEPVKKLPLDAFLISVDCGLFHTCVISSEGDVWSWGMEKGLGLCPDASFTGTDAGDAVSPLRIPCDEQLYGHRFVSPVQVVCGAAHTVLAAHDGYQLWAWGRGRSGVLGRGNAIDSFDPCIMMWPPLDEVLQEGLEETEKKLSLAMEEVQHLQSKLTLMERYASILHGSIFGKPLDEKDLPRSLQNSGTYDIAKEWENILESADHGTLNWMEVFYQNMLTNVKNRLMKRTIQEMIKECLHSSTIGSRAPM